MRTGATIAGALPGDSCHGTRVHLYAGEGAGMALHQDMTNKQYASLSLSHP